MHEFLKELGIEETNQGVCHGPDGWLPGEGEETRSLNPATDEPIAAIRTATEAQYDAVVKKAREAFESWRMTPAPIRGEIVRQLGQALRRYKEPLGRLVSLEMGKIYQEGLGEVQEMIDICDFAVGLSRQLYGKTIHSERPMHRMYEQWHPIGTMGIVTSFNFPVAVWCWNAAIAAVCGNTMIWKPSSKVSLCGVAVQHIANQVMEANGLSGVFNLVVGKGSTIGERLIGDKRIPLISFTGSVRMGRRIGEVVGARLGRTILELGGNNAIVVAEDADLDLATRAIVFGAVGTAGQRCTTTRRIIMHSSIAEDLIGRLVSAYRQVKIGDPLDESVLMGPLIDRQAVDGMVNALKALKEQGGEVVYGGGILEGPGSFVTPCLARARNECPIVQEETFAPILYLIEYENLDDAIAMHNGVPQGLSSAIFTGSLQTSEAFLSARGSDCGIANVNIGTSGAEIGGAFGGEKDTGGGRESGSDAWKGYMRRQTNTINWSTELPLAQGIKFGDD